jgi:hypothetical protein
MQGEEDRARRTGRGGKGEEEKVRRIGRGGQGKARVNDLGIHGLGGM